MVFNLFAMLVALTITSTRLVLAAPNPEVNHLEARNLSPRHVNIMNSRHFRRSRLRKTRSCEAASSTSVNATTPAAPPPTSEDTSITTTSEISAPTADPSSPQETTPAPSASPAPSNSDPNIAAYLDTHNNERAKHGASPLTWADDLAGVAQSWANACVFQHSQGEFGENLAAGSGTSVSASGAVQMWNDEAPDYDPSNPQYSHWTQVVWKGTREVGCAVATCPGESIFGTSQYGTAEFYVCEYRPAGNVIGEFAANVQA